MTGTTNGVRQFARNAQSPLWKEVNGMGAEENKQLSDLIDGYANLQRIITADDIKKEAEYQLKIVKAKLQAFGVATEDLDIH